MFTVPGRPDFTATLLDKSAADMFKTLRKPSKFAGPKVMTLTEKLMVTAL
jgi:hypothetical protein